MNECSDIDCMPCKITAMSTVFNLPILSTAKCSHLYDVETPEPLMSVFRLHLPRKRQWHFLSHSR